MKICFCQQNGFETVIYYEILIETVYDGKPPAWLYLRAKVCFYQQNGFGTEICFEIYGQNGVKEEKRLDSLGIFRIWEMPARPDRDLLWL